MRTKSIRIGLAILTLLLLEGQTTAASLPQGGFILNQGQWNDAVLCAGAWGDARVIGLEDGLLIDLPENGTRRAFKLLLDDSPGLAEPASTRINYFIGSDPEGWIRGLELHRTLVLSDIEFRLETGGLAYRCTEPGELTPFGWQGDALAERRNSDGRSGLILWPGSPAESAPQRDSSDQLLWSTLFSGDSSDDVDEISELAGGDLILYGGTYSSDLPTTPGVYDEDPNGSTDLYFARMTSTGDTLLWCTYVGGSDRDHSDACTTTDDAIYFTGTVMSDDLPVPGALDSSYGGSFDIYLGKLSLDGSTLHWASYLGGSGNDQTNAILVDGHGRVVVAGFSDTPDYPTTLGAVQELPAGDDDIVVTAFEGDGSVIAWSTFLGGGEDENAMGLFLAADGSLLVNGSTRSPDFPVSPGAYDTQITTGYYQNDTVVVKLAGDGGSILWASYLGGSMDSMESGYGIGEDAQGNVVVTGRSKATDFPTTPGAFDTLHGGNGETDTYVTKFSADGSELLWSTFVGGSHSESLSNLIVTPDGGVLVMGYTFSDDFPVTPGAFDESINSAPHEGADVGIALLSPDGSRMTWASYLGGSTGDRGSSMSLTADGNMLVGGWTASSNFPTTPGVYMEEFATPTNHGFISKFMLNGLLTSMEEALSARVPELRAYPNPFNPAVTIDFDLAKAGPVRLRVVDTSGREVTTLIEGVRPVGRGEIVWRPEGLASGLYLLRLETEQGSSSERLVLLK